jgi:predicted kinase
MNTMAVIVFGLPGCGKSYFASRLAERLHAGYLNSDIIRNRLLKEKTYSEAEKAGVYSVMLAEMESALRAGRSVVADATFYLDALRRRFISSIENCGAQARFIEIVADEEVIIERLNSPREFSDADYNVYKKVKEIFEPMAKSHVVIRSERDNIDQMLAEAMAFLEREAVDKHG